MMTSDGIQKGVSFVFLMKEIIKRDNMFHGLVTVAFNNVAFHAKVI